MPQMALFLKLQRCADVKRGVGSVNSTMRRVSRYLSKFGQDGATARCVAARVRHVSIEARRVGEVSRFI